MAGLTKMPNHFGFLDEVLYVLIRLKNTETADYDGILSFCADLLEKVASSADDEEKSERTLVALGVRQTTRNFWKFENFRQSALEKHVMGNYRSWLTGKSIVIRHYLR